MWYTDLENAIPEGLIGPILEIGSGGGFINRNVADILTSEIFFIPGVRFVLDGQKLPFKQSSLKGIVLINVFHHLADVVSFLNDSDRCVRPGGFICMLEPWVTPWSRLIYKYLHHEPFDPDAKTWQIRGTKPLSHANQALAWIVFKRDLQVFQQRFPRWRLVSLTLHTPLLYLLSGGVAFRKIVPGALFSYFKAIEKRFEPVMSTWAMFATLVLIRAGD